MAAANPKKLLASLPLLSDLTEPEVEELAWTAQPFSFVAGEQLFRQGDEVDALYCLERGRVQLSVRLPGDKEEPLQQLGGGDVLGEMALLDRGTRSASARALEPTRGVRIPRRAFDVLRAAYRPCACKVMRQLLMIASRRLRAMTRDAAHKSPASTSSPKSRRPGLSSRTVSRREPVAGIDEETLRLLPVFHAFSHDEMAALLPDLHVVRAPRGLVILRENDPPGSCYVIVRGAVRIFVGADDRRQHLALLGPGRMFGHLALFDASPRSATCETRERTVLLELERARFDELFRAESTVAFKFFEAAAGLVVESLRQANRRQAWIAADVTRREGGA